MWTLIMDMHSGGGSKTAFDEIFIEAPEDEALRIFENRFGRDPHHITCACCGPDYDSHKYKTLEDATAMYRGCHYVMGVGYQERPIPGAKYLTVDEYIQSKKALVIYKHEIADHERKLTDE